MAAQLGNLYVSIVFLRNNHIYAPYYLNVNFASKIHKPDFLFFLSLLGKV